MDLYIIGNGFDINNGLPTRYSDFSKWVKEKYPSEHKKISELFSLNDLWSEFENSIGKCYENIKDIYDEEYSSFDLNDDDYTEEWRMDDNRAHAMQYGMQDKIVDSTTLSKLMKEWLIDVTKQYQQNYIYTEKAIITFNYTDYLKGNNILHIHESISSGIHLQVGHSENKHLEKKFTRRTISDFGNQYPDNAEYFNQLTKYPNISIQKLRGFLYNKKISKLIFFGFSFGEQDIAYFDDFPQDIDVAFYLKDSKNSEQIKSRVSRIFKKVNFIDAKDWKNQYLY